MNRCLQLDDPLPRKVGRPGVVEDLSVLHRPLGIDEEHEAIPAIQECIQGYCEDVIIVSLVVLVQELGRDPVRIRIEQVGPHIDVLDRRIAPEQGSVPWPEILRRAGPGRNP